MYQTESFKQDSFVPARFESDGTITLRGQEISYHTVSEDNVFYGEDGKPIGSLFSYSYFRTNVENAASRPVLFCFNGGPGSSSMFVHAGCFGVKRVYYGEGDGADRSVSLPPFPVIDNPDCLLDVADIVIVEPVGVGFGILIDETKKDQFWGIEEDAESLLMFIEKWMARYNRVHSPKYLVGESYGCTRAATAAGISVSGGKFRGYGVRFDGLVLIGDTVTTGKYFGVEMPVPHSVLRFPTFAAVNWYHNHPSEQTVEEFVAEAKAFADETYLLALYQGEALQGEKRQAVLDRIHYYTGVSYEYLERNQMEIDEDTFRAELLKDKQKAVGRCDGRFTRPLYTPLLAEEDEIHGFWDDASGDSYDSYFYAAMTGTIAPSLNIRLNRVYTPSTNLWRSWNTECKGGTTGERLRNAMNMTWGMRTMFCNGWYDICTEIGFVYYTLDHAGLPHDRCSVKGYPSGHMIYIGEENVKALSEDLRSFITAPLQ